MTIEIAVRKLMHEDCKSQVEEALCEYKTPDR